MSDRTDIDKQYAILSLARLTEPLPDNNPKQDVGSEGKSLLIVMSEEMKPETG